MFEAVRNNRNDRLDIMKGILIILVVLGHTNTILTNWIYSFHMAAFFAISGFLWNDKYVTNKESIIKYVKSRLLRLYLPFVVVNIIFVLIHNWLIELRFYTTDASFAVITADWPVKQICQVYGIKEIVIACLKSFLLMSGSAPLVSTCWFLSTLFIISIGHLVVRAGIRNIDEKKKTIVMWVLLILCFAISYLNTLGLINIVGGIHRLFPAYTAYLFGLLFREYYPKFNSCSKKIRYSTLLIIMIIGFTIVIFSSDIVEISKGYIVNPIYFLFGLLQGTISVYVISILIEKLRISEYIKYLGKKSMSIMLFHVISFKIVNLFLVLIYGRDMVYLASRPVIYNLPQFWSILYLIVGVSIPVSFDLLLDRIKVKRNNGKL